MHPQCTVYMPCSDLGVFVSPGTPKLPPAGGNSLDFQLFRRTYRLVAFRQTVQDLLVVRMVFSIRTVIYERTHYKQPVLDCIPSTVRLASLSPRASRLQCVLAIRPNLPVRHCLLFGSRFLVHLCSHMFLSTTYLY